MSAVYGNNILPFDGTGSAKAVVEGLSASQYIEELLKSAVNEAGLLELDDLTSRSIVKFQSRLLINKLFEKANMALDALTQEVIQSQAPKDIVQTVVGLVGRIATVAKTITDLEAQESGDSNELLRKLQGMEREEALDFLRREFFETFQILFTDEEREVLERGLEKQLSDSEYGSSTNVRAAPDGEVVGSSRWRPRNGPTGVLPPPSRPDSIS